MRAFASDFDGTVFFRNEPGNFKPGDLAAIRRWQASGNLFGVATGRSLVGLLAQSTGAIDFDFYILANGAFILDRDREPVRRVCVRRQTIQALYDALCNQGPIVIHGNDTVYNFGDPLPLQTKIESLDEVGDLIYGLSIWVGEKRVEAVADDINVRFGDELIAYPNTGIVDVVSAGCSKGEAVRIVKERYGISQIAAIGDSFNDIPMMVAADRSYTFATSPERVKSQVDVVVDTLEQAICDFEAR